MPVKPLLTKQSLNCGIVEENDLFADNPCDNQGIIKETTYKSCDSIYIKLICNNHDAYYRQWSLNIEHLDDNTKRIVHDLIPRTGAALAKQHSYCKENPYGCQDKLRCFDDMLASIHNEKDKR